MDITQLLTNEIQSYELNEWSGTLGGEALTLYAKPLSPYDVDQVLKKHPDFLTTMSPGAMADLICRKAVDENGKNVFILNQHRPILERLKVDIVAEIFAALFGDAFEEDSFDLDEMVKNSKRTKSD